MRMGNLSLYQWAEQLDREDHVHRFKEEFYIKKGTIYLDGNSLGLLSRRAENSLLEAVQDWKEYGIDGWLHGRYPWFYLAEKLGAMKEPLVGARPGEVIVTGSTTSNLHQLLATFYQPRDNRTKIITDSLAFPSDVYALQSQLEWHGMKSDKHLLKIQSRDGRFIQEEDILAALDKDVALLILPTVLYRSGQLLDIKRLTAAAHEKGILVGWDAAHSIGSVPHEFHEWEVDFAFWCSYKYLNSGPGGVGGLFVHSKHHRKKPGLAGWFGSRKEKQFDMEHDFSPAGQAGAYQLGTPHIFSMAPLIGSLEMIKEAGMEAIRDKSIKLTDFLLDCLDRELTGMGFSLGTPREEERRGGHVALEHEEAVRICKSLKEHDVIPDFRSPNIIRLAPVALYTSFKDVWHAIQRLKSIMTNRHYDKFEKTRDIIA